MTYLKSLLKALLFSVDAVNINILTEEWDDIFSNEISSVCK